MPETRRASRVPALLLLAALAGGRDQPGSARPDHARADHHVGRTERASQDVLLSLQRLLHSLCRNARDFFSTYGSDSIRKVSSLDAGGYFGEIALLRDLPRTATVTASTPVVLYALDRDDFLAAVTGHAPSAQAAEDVVSARLAGLPTPEMPLSSA